MKTEYTVVNVTNGHCASIEAESAQQALTLGERALKASWRKEMAGGAPVKKNLEVRQNGQPCEVSYD